MKLLVICDESSKIIGHRYLNSQISFYIGILQFGVCVWAIAQHAFSIVLHCDFMNGTKPALLVGVDIIIFDIGLFHSLWGIENCVAQHLDGGYGRLTWCVCHIMALTISLPFAFVSRPRPCALWPLLIQQSAYGVGLLMLSLLALPRILYIFTGYASGVLVLALTFYVFGTAMNSFLLYVYWHWYWHVESMWNSARKLRPNHIVVNPNKQSKRTPIKYRPQDILFDESFPNTEIRPEVKNLEPKINSVLEKNGDRDTSTETKTDTQTPELRSYASVSSGNQIDEEILPFEEDINEFSFQDSDYMSQQSADDTKIFYASCRYLIKGSPSSSQRTAKENYIYVRRCPRKLPEIHKPPMRDSTLSSVRNAKYGSNDFGFSQTQMPRRLLPMPPSIPYTQ